MPRKNRRRNFHSLSDLEDVFDTIPTIDEDFHSPCPNCEQELVILAGQPIRRVKCGRCNEEYTLDRRIGGELCLLRFNAKEYENERAFVVRLKAMKFRVLTLVLACLIVSSVIAAIAYDPVFGFGAVVAMIVGLGWVDAGGRDLRKEHKTGQRRASRRATRRDNAQGKSHDQSEDRRGGRRVTRHAGLLGVCVEEPVRRGDRGGDRKRPGERDRAVDPRDQRPEQPEREREPVEGRQPEPDDPADDQTGVYAEGSEREQIGGVENHAPGNRADGVMQSP